MPSRSEQLRRSKLAQEARQRLQSGIYSQPTEMAPVNPRTAAIRVYNDNLAEETAKKKAFTDSVISKGSSFKRNTNVPTASLDSYEKNHQMNQYTQSNVNSQFITNPGQAMFNQALNSTLTRATNGDPEARKFLENKIGVTFDPHELNRRQIEADTPTNPFLAGLYNYTVKPYAETMNDLAYDNSVGNFASRLGYSAAESMGGAAALQPTTGNKYADIAADVGGVVAGLTAPIGMPGGNLTTAPFKVADQALMTKGGKAVENLLAKPLNKVASPQLSQSIANNVLREGLTGAMQGAGAAAIQGGTEGDMLKQSLIGGLIGGGVGGVGTAAAAPIKRAWENFKTPSVPASNIEPPSHIMGLKPRKPYVEETAGIKRGNIEEPVSIPKEEIPQKSNLYHILFGDQGIGFTPFGSNKSKRMVSSEQQIVSNPLAKSVSGAIDATKQAAKAGYQNLVDHLAPLKKISRATYDSAIDASRANNIANTLVRDKFVDLQGNVIGKSLDDIMKNSRGLGKIVDDYLVKRHAPYRMRRGEQVYDKELNMTPEKAEAELAIMEARYPQLKQIGKDWDQYNKNLRESGVTEDLLTREQADLLERENPHYASMRRQFSMSEKMSLPKWGKGGSAFSGQKAPIKEVSPTGSTRKIVSPLRTAIEQTYAWKNAELRNRTMKELVSSIQNDPNGMKGIAEIVKKPSTSYKSLEEALREGGSEDFLDALDNDFKSLFKNATPGDEHIVRAMIKGTPVYVKVHDPEVVKALLGMGSESSGIVLNALQKLSNATKRGATGLLAPMFAIKNLTADTVQAAIQSPNAVKHITVDLPYAFISSIGDTFKIPGLKNLAEDFRRAGGEYSSLLRGDRALNKSVNTMRRQPLLTPQGLVKGAATTIKAPFKALEKVADVTENVNRIAAYRRSLVGQERTPENIRSAINNAREITTNFSRKGAHAREIEAFVPYSNAAMQGIYRVTKAVVKNPVKTAAAVGLLVVAPKLYEYARFKDDPDYQNLPARERYRNIFISKNEDGTFNKQPMPPEYEAIGAFFTDTLKAVIDNNPDAYKGSLDALANAFTPPIVSGALQGVTQGGGVEKSLGGLLNATTLAPAVALVGNQSFTGAPIVPRRLQGNTPSQQYDERTSSIAKKVGDTLGMSPMKVDYLLRAYGGDPARLLLPLFSDVGGGTAKNTLLKNFITDPVFTNTLSDDFYRMKEKLTQAENDNKTNGVELPDWYDAGISKYVNSTAKGMPSKQLTYLAAEKRDIQADKSLTAEAKSQKLRSIQGEINNIYLDLVTEMKKAGVPSK